MTDQKGVPERTPHHHEYHKTVVDRLSRIEGHVRGVKRMVEEDSPCPELLVQIAAVRSALNSVGRLILEDHMKSCLVDAVGDGDFDRSFKELRDSLGHFIG